MEEFLKQLSMHIPELVTMVLSILLSLGSLIITIIKTKQKSISSKVEKTLSTSSLGRYYVMINEKKVYLSDLHIYKESEVSTNGKV